MIKKIYINTSNKYDLKKKKPRCHIYIHTAYIVHRFTYIHINALIPIVGMQNAEAYTPHDTYTTESK